MSANLRRARRLKAVSQEKLELWADFSRTYVSEVINGKVTLAALLGI
jgi:predicted transcriptional regulator